MGNTANGATRVEARMVPPLQRNTARSPEVRAKVI